MSHNLTQPELEDAYLQRRLAYTQYAPNLPASVKFDLARSALDDDTFENTIGTLGGPKFGAPGVGIASVFENLMTYNPKAVPLTDIRQMQFKLQEYGYLPPNYVPTGMVDSTFMSAKRRADYDALQVKYRGKSSLSADTLTFLSYLGEVMPQSVWEAVVGEAKGIYKQTIENAQSGALDPGNLAAGAMIGATVAGPVGALAGMGIAAGVGFLTDFFHEDEGEGGEGYNRFVDALLPYNYGEKGGAKGFYEDLGYVMTVGSYLYGAGRLKLGYKGAAANVANAGGLRQALALLPESATPGILGKATATRKGRIIGGAAIGGTSGYLAGGDAESFIGGALIGGAGFAALGPRAHHITNASKRIVGNPLLRNTRTMYSGLVAPAMTGRLAGGFGSTPGVADTEIEKGIAEADHGSVDMGPISVPTKSLTVKALKVNEKVPLIGGMHLLYDDLFSVALSPFLYPEGLFRRAGEKGLSTRAIDTFFGDIDSPGVHRQVEPFVKARMLTRKDESMTKARESVWREMGDMQDVAGNKLPEEVARPLIMQHIRVQYGIDKLTNRLMRTPSKDRWDAPWRRAKDWQDQRGQIVKQVNEELAGLEDGTLGSLAEAPTLKSLLDSSYDDPDDLASYMVAMEGIGSSPIENAKNFYKASTLVDEGFKPITETVGPPVAPGKWKEEGYANVSESVPLASLEKLREFDRAGVDALPGTASREKIDALKESISERGFDSPLILGVDKKGRLVLEEGNHRLAAARELGLESVPVRVSVRKSTDATAGGKGKGKLAAKEGTAAKVIDSLKNDPYISADLAPSKVLPDDMLGIKTVTKTPIDAKSKRVTDTRVRETRKKATALREQAAALRDKANKRSEWEGVTNAQRVEWMQEANRLEDLANRYADVAKKRAKKLGRKSREVPVGLARLPNAARHDPGTLTTQDLDLLEQGYSEFKTAYKKLEADAKLAGTDPNMGRTLAERKDILDGQYRSWLDDLAFKGVVYREEIPTLVGPNKLDPEPLKRIKELKKMTVKRLSDESVDPEFRKVINGLGYEMVELADDIVHLPSIQKVIDRFPGLAGDLKADRFRRGALSAFRFVEKRQGSDRAIQHLITAYTASEMQEVMERFGVPLKGKDALNSLNRIIEKERTARFANQAAGPLAIRSEVPFRQRVRLQRQEIRQLKEDEIVNALGLDRLDHIDDPSKVAKEVMAAAHRGPALGAELNLGHPVQNVRRLGMLLGIEGLPGFLEFSRTIAGPVQLGAIGAAAGGVGGYFDAEGDFMEKFKKAAATGASFAAILGGTSAIGLKKGKGHYAYLPEKALNAVMSMRYMLSPSFDMSRYIEQNITGYAKGGGDLAFTLKPKKKLARLAERHREEWVSPYSNGKEVLTDEEIWEHSARLADDFIYESNLLRPIDVMDRRFETIGVLGFNPKAFEQFQSWVLYQRHVKELTPSLGKGAVDPSRWPKEVREAWREQVLTIGRYGSGRSSLEKSIHFIAFPFSFQKKFYSAITDYVWSGPARAFMVHEGVRAYEELKEKNPTALGQIAERYAPLLNTLQQVNNFIYDISPGRWFLLGMGDDATATTKSAQVMTAFLAPGGIAQPLHHAVGLFMPMVLDGKGMKDMANVVDKLAPAIRDVQSLMKDTREQITVLKSAASGGSIGAESWQADRYEEQLGMLKSTLQPAALAAGYYSVESYLQSKAGQQDAIWMQEQKAALGQEFPLGMLQAQRLFNDTEVRRTEIAELQQDPDKSPAVAKLLQLVEFDETLRLLARSKGLAADQIQALFTPFFRKTALGLMNDPHFLELYNRHLAYEYGPIDSSFLQMLPQSEMQEVSR